VASRSRQLISAARAGVPEGTWPVGAGLLVAGLTAYVFQIVAARALTDSDYAALNGLWVVVFVVTPGLFLPIEQEVGRALADRRARGLGGGPLVRRAAALGGILAAAVLVASLVLAPTLVDHFFDGYWLLFAALLVAIVGYYTEHTARGTLSGNGRFTPYGLLLGSEGIVRVLACISLAVAGVDEPGPYGLALAMPPFVAVAIALRGQRGLLRPGPPAPYSELSSALGYLLVGSLLAQFLGYAAFLVAVILAPDGSDVALGGFIAGLFLARIPILLFQAVQAALLPKLANLHGAGRHADFRTGLLKLLAIVGTIGLVGIVGAATIGPWAGELLFGADTFTIGNRDLALLAAGSGGFILALTLAQALIALRDYARNTVAWLGGLAAFFTVVAIGAVVDRLNDDLFLRVELAFIAGVVTTAAVLLASVRQHMHAGDTAGIDPLVEVIERERLEL
jgi:O-antigen/teichoic acid export membrane protein